MPYLDMMASSGAFFSSAYIGVSFMSESGDIRMNNIKKSDQVYAPDGKHFDWLWTMNLHQGELSLRATGYKLYVRSRPILSQLQQLTLSQRGNVSFNKSVPSNESLSTRFCDSTGTVAKTRNFITTRWLWDNGS